MGLRIQMKMLKDTIDMANVFSDRLADLKEAVQYLVGREHSIIGVHRKFITKVQTFSESRSQETGKPEHLERRIEEEGVL